MGVGIDTRELPERYRKQIHEQSNKTLAFRIPDSKPKQNARPKSLAVNADEAGGEGRITIIITRRSCVLLDFDNGVGGCKFLIDQLRYAKLIKDDSPDEIDFVFKQEKVASKKLEGTLVEIKSCQ